MEKDYLHNHPDFKSLLDILESETGISASLIEKDYWIMHVLYSLKKLGYIFELKGGTSLSKGFGIINRFSEDIDIHIKPPDALNINENPNNDNKKNLDARKSFYDSLAEEIKIEGIISINRDEEFDSPNFLSGGIRLSYDAKIPSIAGSKEGILLEAGFDTVTPNIPCNISSWAYDRANLIIGGDFIDNRAIDILCYHPGYTLVEKIQTIIRKFRKEKETGVKNKNFLRHYSDVSDLLNNSIVNEFIGTEEYKAHKLKRIKGKDSEVPISSNEAFLLNDKKLLDELKKRFFETKNLYYNGQPNFEEIINNIKTNLPRL